MARFLNNFVDNRWGRWYNQREDGKSEKIY